MGRFPRKPRQKYDPYGITYNERWKEHPNLRYKNQQQIVPTRPQGFPYQKRPQQVYEPHPQQPPISNAHDPSMVDMIKTLVASNIQTPPVRNPRENINESRLRDGKTYDPPTIPSISNDAPLTPTQSAQQDKDETPTTPPNPKPTIPTYVTTPPFPSRLRKTKKDEAEQEILETFRKVSKELCTNRSKLKGNEKESVGENVSAIPSNTYPRGVVEDVLVKVNELVFLADFYILDMEDDSVPCSAPILLGRPFIKTVRTKIDVHEVTLTMEFDGEMVRFNIFKAIRELIDLKKVDVTTEVKETVAALNNGGDVSKEVSLL
ncbi:uncharacterized protein LOC133824735 [Humulus lupulus]|uniref:uncharacterized protein LOC133824735 n=1 Tax=Humulus lupulus TaxID=3486 RepID=UPI002B402E9A|nr:uncharacterized protein LOC133824735 [Humulus lupulus]